MTDAYSRVRLYWCLARLNDLQGRPAAALDYVRRAIALLGRHRRHAPPRPRALALRRHPDGSQGRAEDAGRNFDLAEQLFGPNPEPVDVASLYTDQARRAVQLGDGDEASRRATSGARRRRRRVSATSAATPSGRWPNGSRSPATPTSAHESFRQATTLLEKAGPPARLRRGLPRLGQVPAPFRPRGRGARGARARRRPRRRARRRRPPRPAVISAAVRPRGPYSLRATLRHGSDATRSVIDGVLVAALACGGAGRAWQQADGVVQLRAPSEAGIDELRFVLALDDDHSEFVKRFARDPLIGEAIRRERGLRPLRTATVAQSLLRAVCGQLIQASRARQIERTVIRSLTPQLTGTKLHAPPSCETFGRVSPAELRRLGLGMRRGASLVRICRSLELERLRSLPGDALGRAAAARARPRPLVGRRRLPRGPRPLRPRARRRPRAREAPLRAPRPLGRGLGDRRAARALRRVGRPREHLPAARVRQGARAPAENRGCLDSRGGRPTRRHPRRRHDRRVAPARAAERRLARAGRDRRHRPRRGARARAGRAPRRSGHALERRGRRRRGARRDRGQAAGLRRAARRDRRRADARADRALGGRRDPDRGDRAPDRRRRPGRARDAEPSRDRPRGDRRHLRRRPRRRRAPAPGRGGAQPPRRGRRGARALHGRGHRRLGLRAPPTSRCSPRR